MRGLPTLRSLWPAAPVNMSAPSLSNLNELQEQLDKISRLAANELSNGADRIESRVALFQKQVDILIAQTKLVA